LYHQAGLLNDTDKIKLPLAKKTAAHALKLSLAKIFRARYLFPRLRPFFSCPSSVPLPPLSRLYPFVFSLLDPSPKLQAQRLNTARPRSAPCRPRRRARARPPLPARPPPRKPSPQPGKGSRTSSGRRTRRRGSRRRGDGLLILNSGGGVASLPQIRLPPSASLPQIRLTQTGDG
jgi:hypothetical protein